MIKRKETTMDKELLSKAVDGAIIGLSALQEMIADKDERIFDSAMLSRIEEIKKVIKILNER